MDNSLASISSPLACECGVRSAKRQLAIEEKRFIDLHIKQTMTFSAANLAKLNTRVEYERAINALKRRAAHAQLQEAEAQLALAKIRFSIKRTTLLAKFCDETFDADALAALMDGQSTVWPATSTADGHSQDLKDNETVCSTDVSVLRETSITELTKQLDHVRAQLATIEDDHHDELAWIHHSISVQKLLVRKQDAQTQELDAFISRVATSTESEPDSAWAMLQQSEQSTLDQKRERLRVMAQQLLQFELQDEEAEEDEEEDDDGQEAEEDEDEIATYYEEATI